MKFQKSHKLWTFQPLAKKDWFIPERAYRNREGNPKWSWFSTLTYMETILICIKLKWNNFVWKSFLQYYMKESIQILGEIKLTHEKSSKPANTCLQMVAINPLCLEDSPCIIWLSVTTLLEVCCCQTRWTPNPFQLYFERQTRKVFVVFLFNVSKQYFSVSIS